MAGSKRKDALKNTLSSIEKRFGEGAIMRLGEAADLQVEVVPTGCLALDIALGVGGLPRGRVVEIYGPESSGKTTLCQQCHSGSSNAGWDVCLHRYGARA